MTVNTFKSSFSGFSVQTQLHWTKDVRLWEGNSTVQAAFRFFELKIPEERLFYGADADKFLQSQMKHQQTICLIRRPWKSSSRMFHNTWNTEMDQTKTVLKPVLNLNSSSVVSSDLGLIHSSPKQDPTQTFSSAVSPRFNSGRTSVLILQVRSSLWGFLKFGSNVDPGQSVGPG